MLYQSTCNIPEHKQSQINSICLDQKCKGTRVCCYMCKTKIHDTHLNQLVDVEYLLDFIKKQSLHDSSSQVSLASQDLNKVKKQIDELSKLIQNELDRLDMCNLQVICEKIGNQYNILEDEIDGLNNRKLHNLAQEILEFCKLSNGRLQEKQQFSGQLDEAHLLFMNTFQEKIKNRKPIQKQSFYHRRDWPLGYCVRSRYLPTKESTGVRVFRQKKLWDLQNYTLIKTYSNFGAVYDVVLSNQGDLIAFAGEGDFTIKQIEIRDLDKVDIVSNLQGHKSAIFRLAFSNDSKYLISGSQDQTVKIWDANSKIEAIQLNSESVVVGVAISSDDTLIAANSDDFVRIWELKNQKLLCSQLNESFGKGISFSNDKNIIVTSHSSGWIKMWSLQQLNQKQLILIREFKVANNHIWTALFSPCDNFIICICNSDGEIKIIDSQTGQTKKVFNQKSLNNYVSVGIAISKNMVAYGKDNSIVIVCET